ncbi:hypothetical protein D3C76_1227600 [compost metagenome]
MRQVRVENTDNMTDEEIIEKAVDLYNDPPDSDDMYVHDGNVVSIDHEPGDTSDEDDDQ